MYNICSIHGHNMNGAEGCFGGWGAVSKACKSYPFAIVLAWSGVSQPVLRQEAWARRAFRKDWVALSLK